MEADLRDALIVWQGGELPGARCEELLARVRTDGNFRRALVEETWTLSQARVAQAPAPRWLALHEELGLTTPGQEGTDERRESALLAALQREPAPFVDFRWRRAAYGLMGVAAMLMLFFGLLWFRRPPVEARSPTLAVVVHLEQAVWKNHTAARFAPGSTLGAGRLQLVSGRASLMFTSGVSLDFAGPTDIDLLAVDRVTCREGRLRTKAPHGAEGFCVETPRGAVTDLGTQVGVSVAKDGRTDVAVFEGQAEVSLQMAGQQGIRSAVLKAGDSAELIPETGEIRPVSADDFLAASPSYLPPLRLARQYPETIRAAHPLHYWRLDREVKDSTPDEMGDAISLQLAGGVEIRSDDEGHRSAFFPGEGAPGVLYLEKPLTIPSASYAVEMWFVTETTAQVSLIGLTASENERRHLTLVEIGSRRPGHAPEVGVVRYLMRWPASSRGGMNIFSPPGSFPRQWRHLVAQHQGDVMQLYLDGKSAGSALATAFPAIQACPMHFGCLAYTEGDSLAKLERPFAGRLAEIAIYDRLLTPAEIRQHAGLGSRAGP